MQNERCEAILVTDGYHPTASEVGQQCPEPGEVMALEGPDGCELRCLCWTHRATVEAGTREVELVPLPASVAAE